MAAASGSRSRGATARRRAAFLLATAAAIFAVVLAMLPTAFATTAIINLTAASVHFAAAATAMMARFGNILTAHEGQSNDREENRDPKNQRAIHPRVLQKYRNVRFPNRKTLPSSHSPPNGRRRLLGLAQPFTSSPGPSSLPVRAALSVSLFRLRSLDTDAQSRLLN